MQREGFDRRSLLAGGAGALAALSTMSALTEAARADGDAPPNFLWIAAEDLSPYLGAYGDPFAQTPNLDRLARDGVRFELAYSAAPTCAPSRFALLTGDRPGAARAVAEAIGPIDDVQAELLPADKARWIDARTREGARVAMVGDGVNDAPALAAATVGIALGGVGSDIAAEAGDLVLMGDPLRPLPQLLRLGKVPTVRVLRREIGGVESMSGAAWGLGAAALLAIIFWIAGDLKLGLMIAGGFAVALAVFALGAWWTLRALASMKGRGALRGGGWRYGLASLSRRMKGSVIQASAVAVA